MLNTQNPHMCLDPFQTQPRQIATRIVRGSDYSPASELFSSVRKTMSGNNPKLDLVNIDARKKRLVRFCQFILKILSGNEILTSIKGHNSLKIYGKITGNNPKLDIVNVDAIYVHNGYHFLLMLHIKFGFDWPNSFRGDDV